MSNTPRQRIREHIHKTLFAPLRKEAGITRHQSDDLPAINRRVDKKKRKQFRSKP